MKKEDFDKWRYQFKLRISNSTSKHSGLVVEGNLQSNTETKTSKGFRKPNFSKSARKISVTWGV